MVKDTYLTVPRGVFKTLPNILDGTVCKNNDWLIMPAHYAVDYCHKTLHLRCLTGFSIRLCLRTTPFENSKNLSR